MKCYLHLYIECSLREPSLCAAKKIYAMHFFYSTFKVLLLYLHIHILSCNLYIAKWSRKAFLNNITIFK